MAKSIGLIVYPVEDLARARALYQTLLGVEPYVDQPYYVGFRIGEQEIGLDPQGHKKGLTGPIGYWPVEDIRGSLKSLLDAGAVLHQDVTGVGQGKLIAMVKDADGNVTGLIQN